MKKSLIPLIAVLIFALWPLSKLRGLKSPADGFTITEFANIPVLYEGRLQPIDSLARNAMLQLRKKQTLNLEPWKGEFGGPKIITAADWIVELMMNPSVADGWPCFRIDHSDIKGLLNLPMDKDEAAKQDGKHYTWNQISPHYVDLMGEAERAGRVDAKLRNSYENTVIDLIQAVNLYRKLKATLGPAAAGGDLNAEMVKYRERLTAARAALDAREAGQAFEEKDLDWLSEQMNTPLILPPVTPDKEWLAPVIHVRDSTPGSEPHPALAFFSRIASAWKAGDKKAFGEAVTGYREWIKAHPAYVHVKDQENGKPPGDALAHTRKEQIFNLIEPFYCGMVISVVALLSLILYWFNPNGLETARRTGVGLMWLVFAILTGGILFRMFQEGRPPVTNLYSSALLIGWGAVLAGLILEMIFPRAVGAVVAAKVVFGVLLVAHFLSLDGDTMIMLQAVLDTNFWLATHVVIVTLGYMATFVAGILGIVYVILALGFGQIMTKQVQRIMAGMAFAIICFGTLFSFVGTVLGGLWADQSWGRFWGWDPKENGALMIVLWNALILHARLGGMVRERGLLILCIGGNIITAWSWFGTNLLGIGLHSYGFMSAASIGLYCWYAFNVVLIILGIFAPKPRPAVAQTVPGEVPAVPAVPAVPQVAGG